MRQTLFYIPETLFGLPVFGFGIAFAILTLSVIAAAVWHFVQVKKWDSEIANYFGLWFVGCAVLVFVVPNVSEAHQGFPIRGYGFFLLTAIICSLLLILNVTKPPNITAEQVFSLCLWAVVCGIIGARLFYVTEYWNEIAVWDAQGQFTVGKTLFNVLNIVNGGLVVFGSIIGGIIGSLIYLLRKKIPVLPTFDMMAPAMFLGIAIGRLGCLMNGCCFGGICDYPWAITFPAGSPVHVHQIEHGETFFDGMKLKEGGLIAEVQAQSPASTAGLLPGMVLKGIGANVYGKPQSWAIHSVNEAVTLIHSLRLQFPDNDLRYDVYTDSSKKEEQSLFVPFTPSTVVMPVHPTQIYSSIIAAVFCAVLLCLRRLKTFRLHDGLLFCTFLFFYSVARFVIEVIRTDEDSFMGTGLTVSQNVSIGVFFVGIALMFYILRPIGRGKNSEVIKS